MNELNFRVNFLIRGLNINLSTDSELINLLSDIECRVRIILEIFVFCKKINIPEWTNSRLSEYVAWQNRPINRFDGPRRSTRKEERASRLRMHAADRSRSIESPQVPHFFRIDTRVNLSPGDIRASRNAGTVDFVLATLHYGGRMTKTRPIGQSVNEEIATYITTRLAARPPKDWWSQGMRAIYNAWARSEVRRVRALEISLLGTTLARAPLRRIASPDKRMINYCTHSDERARAKFKKDERTGTSQLDFFISIAISRSPHSIPMLKYSRRRAFVRWREFSHRKPEIGSSPFWRSFIFTNGTRNEQLADTVKSNKLWTLAARAIMDIY